LSAGAACWASRLTLKCAMESSRSAGLMYVTQ
jgi:hypothetical protein